MSSSASSSSSSSLLLPERVVLGTIADLKLTVGPVKRNLFGPVDHQQLQQDFQKLLSVSVEEANQRWSYDFLTDRPASDSDSAVEWEELRCQDVPAFYRSCLVKRVGAAAKAGGAVAEMGMTTDVKLAPGSPVSSCSSGEEYLEVTTRGCYRLQRSEKKTARHRVVRRRQATITDFFSVQKRRFLHHKRPSLR